MEKYIIDNFLKRFVQGEKDKCWEWIGSFFVTGYGNIRPRKGIQLYAHRVSYMYFVGEIPKGLVIDHLCENRKCVNPNHLEPTTIVDNIQRTFDRGKPRKNKKHLVIGGTCLKRGHQIESDADIIHYSYGDNYCRKCRKMSLNNRNKTSTENKYIYKPATEKRVAQMKKWREANREHLLKYARQYNKEYYLRKKGIIQKNENKNAV